MHGFSRSSRWLAIVLAGFTAGGCFGSPPRTGPTFTDEKLAEIIDTRALARRDARIDREGRSVDVFIDADGLDPCAVLDELAPMVPDQMSLVGNSDVSLCQTGRVGLPVTTYSGPLPDGERDRDCSVTFTFTQDPVGAMIRIQLYCAEPSS